MLITLPSRRRVRVRQLRSGVPPGQLPEFGVYLSAVEPRPHAWPSVWVRWGRRGLPDHAVTETAILQAWWRCNDERVEIACSGGTSRAGLAVACLAVLDGAPPVDAIRIVKDQYENWTAGTPMQRRFVNSFARGQGSGHGWGRSVHAACR